MSYHDLIDYIIKEGDEKAADILAKAKEKADAMLSEIGRKLEEQRENALNKLGKDIAEYKVMELNIARHKGNALITVSKGAIIDELYMEIDSTLQSITDGPLYPAILRQLLIEGLHEMSGRVVVRANSKDCRQIKDFMKDNTLPNCEVISVIEDDRIKGGVEIISEDRCISIINTLWSRLDKIKNDLLPEIREILFPTISNA